jgi:hypothetical protein
VDGVVGLLVLGKFPAGGFLGREAEEVGFTLVAEVGQGQATVLDPVGDALQENGVGAGSGGVVLASGPHIGGPQRPSVRGRKYLDVPAVVFVLPTPPEIDSGRGTGPAGAVGWDQRAAVPAGGRPGPRWPRRGIRKRYCR